MKNRIVPSLSLMIFAFTAPPAVAQNQSWIRQLGTTGSDFAWASAPDAFGGVFIGGYTGGTLGGPSAGSIDGWLARYDSAGSQVWIRQFGSSGGDIVHTAAPDGSGGAYVGGTTDAEFGGPHVGGWDAWLARYDGSGNLTWKRQLGTAADDAAYASAPDGSGGVFVGGYTDGSLGGPFAGARDVWLAHYDSTGNQLWIRQYGTASDDTAFSAASDGSGGMFVGGWTAGSLGGPTAGSYDAWLGHYDGAGNQTWIRQIGSSGYDELGAVARDTLGGVFVGGYTNGSLSGPFAGGQNDAWLARYDSIGNQTWIRQLGTSGGDFVSQAASDGSGGVYVVGGTDASLGGPTAGGYDAWLGHYDGAGSQTWIQQLGSTAEDQAYAAAPNGSGGVFVSGITRGSLGGPFAGAYDAWLARYDGPNQGPLTYCTAKLNSLGCTPSIGWMGTATSSGPIDDFYVTATNVLNRKPGIMIWSTQPGSTPLGGGTLCIAPPVIRTPGQASGGSSAPLNDCTGQYSFHFDHAYIQSYFLATGQVIRAQYWSRDPWSGPPSTPTNIGLTNGLSFVIGP